MWKRVDGMRAVGLSEPGQFRDDLNAQVLAGKKTATAGPPTCEKHAQHRASNGSEVAILDCGHGSITSLLRQVTPSGSLPADSIDGPGTDARPHAQGRISLDANHENGADVGAIFSEEADELLKKTGEKLEGVFMLYQPSSMP